MTVKLPADVELRVAGIANHVWHVHSEVLEKAAGLGFAFEDQDSSRRSGSSAPAGQRHKIYPGIVKVEVDWDEAFENSRATPEETICAILVLTYRRGGSSKTAAWTDPLAVTQALRTLVSCRASAHIVVEAFLQNTLLALAQARCTARKRRVLPLTRSSSTSALFELLGKAIDLCSQALTTARTARVEDPAEEKAPEIHPAADAVVASADPGAENEHLCRRLSSAQRKIGRLSRLLEVKLDDHTKLCQHLERVEALNRRLSRRHDLFPGDQDVDIVKEEEEEDPGKRIIEGKESPSSPPARGANGAAAGAPRSKRAAKGGPAEARAFPPRRQTNARVSRRKSCQSRAANANAGPSRVAVSAEHHHQQPSRPAKAAAPPRRRPQNRRTPFVP